jgi:diguanylate cyclase (GGDEF)-like protein
MRPKVLLVGDASARPTGLERALTRAGFQLVEREELGTSEPADAILITISELNDGPLTELLPPATAVNHAPPSLVLISEGTPDGAAAALELGASDAVIGPVHLPELCARLHARIREHRLSNGIVAGGHAAMASTTSPDTVNGREPVPGSSQHQTDQLDEMLEQRVQEEFERARRYSLSFSLILLGIDELQGSDERMGTEAASQLRCEVTRTLRLGLRVPDLVVPYGPDEFAIVLPETGQAGARQSVLRARERLTSLPLEGDPRLEPTRFSAGIVTYPHPAALEPEDLFAMAEAALMRGRAQAIERIGVAV